RSESAEESRPCPQRVPVIGRQNGRPPGQWRPAGTTAGSDLVGPEIAAEDLGVVFDRVARNLLDQFQDVELAGGILVALHHIDVLEALMVVGAILGRTVAGAVELETFQRL